MKQTYYAYITGWNAGDWYTEKTGQIFQIEQETAFNYMTKDGPIYKLNAKKSYLYEHEGKWYAIPYEIELGDPANGIATGIWKEVRVPADPVGFPAVSSLVVVNETGQFKDGDFKKLDERIQVYNKELPVIPDFFANAVLKFTVEDSVPNPQHKILVAHLRDGSKYVVAGDPNNPTYLEKYETAFDVDPIDNARQ